MLRETLAANVNAIGEATETWRPVLYCAKQMLDHILKARHGRCPVTVSEQAACIELHQQTFCISESNESE